MAEVDQIAELDALRAELEALKRSHADADRALQEGRLRLTLALQGGDLGGWDWVVGSATVTVTRRWLEIVGEPGTADEMEYPAAKWISAIHPDDLPAARALASDVVSGKTNHYTFEYRVGAEGRWRWVRSTARAVGHNADGTAQRLAGTLADISERKVAEEALKESAQYYRALFENTRAPRLVIDTESGEIRNANSAACAFYGYTREQLLALHAWDLNITGEAETRRHMSIAASAQAMFEVKHRLASGEVRDVQIFAGPVQVGGKTLLHPIIIDVTARRRAEEALKESAEFYRTLFEGNRAPKVLVDPSSGHIADANSAACELSGYARSALLKLHIWDLNTLGEASVRERMAKAGASQTEFDFKLRRADGELRDVRVYSGPVRPGGRALLYSIIIDITDRRRAEEALEESERRHRSLFEGSRDALMTLEPPSWAFTNFNQAAVEMFGGPALTSHGQVAPWQLSPPTQPDGRRSDEKAAEIIERALREGSHTFDWTHRRLSGEDFPCKVVLSRVEANGRVFLQGSVRDVTVERRGQEEQARLVAQLHEAQKMESVGRLAGGVAHDFNNMLGVILGHAEAALDEPLSPTLREDLQEIRQAARRSADLTRQLLAFARRQTIAPRVIDLNEQLSGMLKMLRRLVGETIALSWEPALAAWPVKVDPAQLDQVLANLCVNARDAMPSGGRLIISTANCTLMPDMTGGAPSAHGEHLCLSVRDEGVGMSDEVKARLFEPFFTTKQIGRGTGLGLATVYGIVKQNGGSIRVVSAPGAGTTFFVYLPRATSEDVAAAGGAPKDVGRGQEMVLLVEDEPALLRATLRMLEAQGYQVLPASTASEALRLAQKHAATIRLLLTDVVMPEMNGRDLATKVTSIQPGMKLLFMSGYTADVIAHHGVLEHGTHFIQKPFTKLELGAKVREILGAG